MNAKEKWFNKAVVFSRKNYDAIHTKLRALTYLVDISSGVAPRFTLIKEIDYESYRYTLIGMNIDKLWNKRIHYGLTSTLGVVRLNVGALDERLSHTSMLGMYILMWYHLTGEDFLKELHNSSCIIPFVEVQERVHFFIDNPEFLRHYQLLKSAGILVSWKDLGSKHDMQMSETECNIFL